MSLFLNDPFETLAEAFAELYPDKQYDCQWVDDLNVANSFWGEMRARVLQLFGKATGAWGSTVFPDDGSTPLIEIDVTVPMCHAVEIFGHELAHVAVGPDADHGEEWEKAFERIHQRYEELLRMKYDNWLENEE